MNVGAVSATLFPPGLLRRVWAKLVLSLALGGLFAWLAARGGLPLIPPADAFLQVSWSGVGAYVSTLWLVHLIRATRWRFLIAPVRRLALSEVILLNWIGFFAIFALPLRLGELARPGLCKARHAISVSAGLGTVAVERVADGLVTSTCVAWALFVLPRQETSDPLARHLPSYGYASLLLFGCAFGALAMFLWQRELAVTLTRRTLGILSPRLAAFLAGKVAGVADGLRSLAEPRLAGGFLAETCVYWTVNALGVWLLGNACGLPMTFGHAVAIMGVLAIGILLPTGPGLFGNFQLAVSVTLKLYLAESVISDQGAAFVFLLYIAQASVMTLAGIVPLYIMKLRLRDLFAVRG